MQFGILSDSDRICKTSVDIELPLCNPPNTVFAFCKGKRDKEGQCRIFL